MKDEKKRTLYLKVRVSPKKWQLSRRSLRAAV